MAEISRLQSVTIRSIRSHFRPIELFRSTVSTIGQYDLFLLILPWLLALGSLAVLWGFAASNRSLFQSQIVFVSLGIVLQLILARVDYRFLKALAPYLYATGLLLLIVVMLIGQTRGGATRWLDIGFFALQPSELMKFMTVVMLASFLSVRRATLGIRELVSCALVIAFPAILTLVQPDFGSSLVLAVGTSGVLLTAQFERSAKQLLACALLLLLLVSVFAYLEVKPFGSLLKDYQRVRITSFLDPSSDPYGAGYNVRQATIAVGSGGLTGKGLGAASQSELQFLPVPHTDFIFASLSETWGFMGGGVVLLLYLVIFFRLMALSGSVEDRFGLGLTLGFGTVLLAETTINIGMNLGLLPVTGVPLPFLSHGGSQTIISFAMLGVLQSLFRRRSSLSF